MSAHASLPTSDADAKRRRAISQCALRQLVNRLAVAGIAAVVALTLPPVSTAAGQRRFTNQHVCSAQQQVVGCLIVLGSGTPAPDPERAGAAYAVVYRDRTFLFDAGSGIMRRVAAAGLTIDDATRLFLTHLHSDHTLGLPDVMLTTWVMGRKRALSIVGPPGTLRMTDLILSAWKEDITMRTDGLEHGQRDGEKVRVNETRGGIVYDSAGVRITAVRVPHGDWGTALGYVVETPTRKFAFSGDTGPADAFFAAAKGVDVLVHESYPAVRLRPEDRPGGEEWPRYMHTFHTSDVEIGTLSAKYDVKFVVLSHVVWMGGTPAELIAGVRQGGFTGPVRVAKDLDVY